MSAPLSSGGAPRRRRDERGQTTILIIGFASILMVAVAVVIDASAAFMQRQDLDTVADGAALRGADLGSVGTFPDGLPERALEQTEPAVRAAVADYLRQVGAYAEYPGLSYTVRVDAAADRVVVRISAPMDLPLSVPGALETTTVAATGSASVRIAR